MLSKVKIKTLVFAGVIALIGACTSGQLMLKDPKVMLAYEMEPSPENLDNLAKAYGSLINKNRKTGIRQPGLYADYAVALAQQGKAAEANIWFNNEMDAFPSSKQYVMQLKKQLIPQYLNDTTHNFNLLPEDTENDESEAIQQSARHAAAVERAATVMQGTNDSIDNSVIEPIDSEPEIDTTVTTPPAPRSRKPRHKSRKK